MFRRTRYQQGSLPRVRRKRGPDCWVFRWYALNGAGRRHIAKLLLGRSNSIRHANSRITLDIYTQALTPAKREVLGVGFSSVSVPSPVVVPLNWFVMSERLKGKIGIVTGAGSGIGRACAIALASEGARVTLVRRRRDRVEEVAHEIGDSAFAIPADVSKTGDVSRLIDETVSHFGRLNFLLNNAGVLHIGNAEQITAEQWDHTFNVNVRAVWQLSRAALPHMRKVGGASIINVASTLEVVGARNRAAYAASKA
jgi:hypothetical protein